jgi:protocatechuate 4,5-dioxygenase alpha chain
MSRYTASAPGTYVYDGEVARRGFGLNKFAYSLADRNAREAFLADESAYLDRFDLTPEQRDAVLRRDWLALVQLGGNIYYIFKLTALGSPMKMSELGAAQVGLQHDEFVRRNTARGKDPWPA